MGPSGHFYSFLFICGPGVVVVKIWDRLYLGIAPRTKEILPDFHEWCRVTSIPLVDELSTDPPKMGRHMFKNVHHLYGQVWT